jgi:hypothetical protein
MGGGQNITLTDSVGDTCVIVLDNGTPTSADGVIGGNGAATPEAFAQRIVEAITATAVGASTCDITATAGGTDTVTVTQGTAGITGNKTNSTTNTQPAPSITVNNFENGTSAASNSINPDVFSFGITPFSEITRKQNEVLDVITSRGLTYTFPEDINTALFHMSSTGGGTFSGITQIPHGAWSSTVGFVYATSHLTGWNGGTDSIAFGGWKK